MKIFNVVTIWAILLSVCAAGDRLPSSPQRIIHPQWAPKVIQLKPDDVTTIMGYRAELEGHLMHLPMPEPRFYPIPDIYGFVDASDRMTFRVIAPVAGAYNISVLCNARRDLLDGIQVEVCCGDTRLTARPVHPKTPDGPGRLTFERLRFSGVLHLRQGENKIVLRLSELSQQQTELVQKDLSRRKIPARDTSFRVWSIELVRPEAMKAIQKRAQELRTDIDWMVEGKYGLFTHWSPLCYPLHGETQTKDCYQEAVDRFDVDAYVDMVEQTGAAWVVFTTSHGPHYWPGPSETIDRILPGRTCRRDLIGELADALRQDGIRLMLYYHTGSEDEAWAKSAGMHAADSTTYFDNIVAIHREASQRYRQRLASTGVYIDTSPRILYQLDFPYERLTRAVKSGNPQAVVGYSTDRLPMLTSFADIPSQDGADWIDAPMPDQWFGRGNVYDGLQRGRFFYMDDWIPRKPFEGEFPPPRHETAEYVQFFKQMAARRVPLTVNLMITQDVTREQPFVSPASMEIMKQVRRAIRGE